jgi:flagellar hook-associated protein 3 FlgL
MRISDGMTIATNDTAKTLFFNLPTASVGLSTTTGTTNTGTGVIGTPTITAPPTTTNTIYTITFNALNPGSNYTITQGATPVTGYVDVAFNPGDTITIDGISVAIAGTPAPTDVFTLTIQPNTQEDIFTTTQNLINNISTYSSNPSLLSYYVGIALDNIEYAQDSLLNVRAQIGARLNVIDDQNNTNSENKLLSQELLSNLQDLDFAEAISNYQLQMTALEAGYKSFNQLAGLSLFDYLL